MSRPLAWSGAAQSLFSLVGPTAVSAGAGSGKTTCLVELCLRLLSGEATGTPCDPGEIVAITFTEKAAAELDERLREGVAARAAAAAPGSGEERAWRLHLHALDRMSVGTIHGFARRILREHALEAGLDPGLDVLDEETSRAWRRRASREAVLAALDAGREGALLLVAAQGAGGQRAGLADTVAELARERATLGDDHPLEPAAEPREEALAARAALLTIADALVAVRGEVATGTGRRALGRVVELLGRFDRDRSGPLRPELLLRVGELTSALRGWRNGKADGERPRVLKEALARSCEAFPPLAAEALSGPQQRELCALVREAEQRYRARKREARALDFDDLLIATRELLRSPAGPRDELRRRFRALLVDEYQDVNRLQQDLFELLAGGSAPGPVLVAVGDLKQSIYRFRGADVAAFGELLARFGRADGSRVLHLTTNHRSSPPVLELVNTVFARCMQPGQGPAREYELAFRDSDRLVAARGGNPGPPCEILEDAAPGCAADRRRREARAIAERIGALVSGVAGVAVTERPGADGAERARAPRHGDVALLFRRLTQIGEYERALREAGIPYRLARGGGFYQAPEVRDLGELLATLADPADVLAWAALLRSPSCGLSDGALLAVSRLGLATLARRLPRQVAAVVAAADPEAAGEAARLERLLVEWQALLAVRDRLSLPDLLARAIERLDVEAAHLAAPDGERRLVNVRKALVLAARFAERGGTAADFAQRLRAMAREPPREPEAELEAGDAVALLSIHQAKGLEWPIVFVPDMGALPRREGRRALRTPAGLAAAYYDGSSGVHHPTRALLLARQEAARAGAAESRRLLYVALTRARDRLVLSGEAARGAETWRGLVEEAIAHRPDLVVRIPIERAASFGPQASGEPPRAALVGLAVSGDGPGPASEPAVRSGTSTTSSPGAPSPAAIQAIADPAPLSAVRLAVTQLAEQARCPRRVHLRKLGLAEQWQGPGGGSPQDDPDRATARGTLAHAMVAEADLSSSPLERRAQLAAVASRRGYDPQARGVRRIMADVSRFLDSPAGVALARAGRAGTLRREVPFVLRLEGGGAPTCYLVGAIDALVDDGKQLAIVDFKYALARPGAEDRYRFQLLAYALAAGRALPGRKLTARVQFLRGACRAVDVTPGPGDLRRFARDAPHLALAAHQGGGRCATPSELGRTEERCAGERCGFVARCYR